MCGRQSGTEPDIGMASWLIGTWQHATEEAEIFETWKIQHEKEFHGMGYMLNGEDTLVFEDIRLLEENGQLYYIPLARGQNDGQPVTFELMTANASKMVFENQEHDYPQLISYTRITEDSLVAEISGILNKELRIQKYPMIRKE